MIITRDIDDGPARDGIVTLSKVHAAEKMAATTAISESFVVRMMRSILLGSYSSSGKSPNVTSINPATVTSLPF
jgi:hypothetical protein